MGCATAPTKISLARRAAASIYHDGLTPAAALTTAFSMPDSCITSSVSPFYDLLCMPPNFAEVVNGHDYYSPGVCPMSYEAACTTLADGYISPTLEAGETAVYCCPSGYGCASSTGLSWSHGVCITSDNYYSADYELSAFAIQVRWQSTDLDSLYPTPSLPIDDFYVDDPSQTAVSSYLYTSTNTGPRFSIESTRTLAPTLSSQSVSVASATTATSTQKLQPQGLSTGSKIGIGIAVPIGFLGIIAGLITCCFLFWRRRKSKSSSSGSTQELPQPSGQYASVGKSVQVTHTPNDYEAGLEPLPPARGAAGSTPPRNFSNPRALSASPSPPPNGVGMAISAGSPARRGLSSLPEVVQGRSTDDEEIRQIQIEQAKLQERRSRLFQMAQLDQEEERLKRRLETRMSNVGGGQN